jgi:hypothetical protein
VASVVEKLKLWTFSPVGSAGIKPPHKVLKQPV